VKKLNHYAIKEKMGRAQLIALCALALCGCESPVAVKTPVSEADFRDFRKTSDSTVSGQIPRYSKVPVHLDPATPYSDALYKALGQHRGFDTANEDETEAVDPIMLQHRRTSVADTDGAFTFDHVAPGRYYLAWYDSWREHSEEVANRDPLTPVGISASHEFSFESPRGKWHFKEVTVRSGESLSDVDFD
jgi:hypothetical protein